MKKASTQQLIKLNAWAEAHDMNRSISQEGIEKLDPQGVHICIFEMIHNRNIASDPIHLRTMWMVKMKGTKKPTRIFLDIDPSMLASHSEEISMSEETA